MIDLIVKRLVEMAKPFADVLDAVLTYGARDLDQKDVAELSGASTGTVSSARKAKGEVEPLLCPAPVGFSAEMGLILSCSIGSESVRCGLVDANGVVHHPKSAEAKRDQLQMSPDDLLARVRHQVIRTVEEAFDDSALLRKDRTLPVLAAALALPAPVDRAHLLRGRALPHPEWRRKPSLEDGADELGASLNRRFAAMLGPPFSPATAQVMNDCNAAAVAMAFERVRELEPPRTSHDDARRERTMAMLVRVSGGVGMSMIEVASDSEDLHVSRFLKSRVSVGTNGLSGEIGHVPVSPSAVENVNARSKNYGVDPLDWARTCSCGRPHHLQALTGWHALCERLGLRLDDPSETLTEKLEPFLSPPAGHEDEVAVRALGDAGRLIGRALTGPVLALDPHSVTVVGALAVPSLLAGMVEAQGEWSKAFWTGRKVAFDKPLHGSKFMALRGAGLVLLRAHRHRKLREIGDGAWSGLAPLLPYSSAHLSKLRRSAEP